MPREQRRGFLEELQSLDEPTKKRVLIITTAIAMVVVIYIWLAYFNNLVAGVSQPVEVSSSTPQPSYGVSIWQNMYQGIIGTLHGLGNILQAPREYLIKPPH
ncbi:MAG: hypothetical protein ABSC29_00605 [Minisyncoccia bacterium]|jgi:hypothetical protein